jgi:hypothetical protein
VLSHPRDGSTNLQHLSGFPRAEALIARGYIPEIFLCDPGKFRGIPQADFGDLGDSLKPFR